MLIILAIIMIVMVAAIAGARLYTRRELTVYDRWCSAIDDELAGRVVVREQVAA